MTRKEELIDRGKKRIDSIYGSRAEHCMGASYDEYVLEVMGDYLQVEGEVWEKPAKHFENGYVSLWQRFMARARCG